MKEINFLLSNREVDFLSFLNSDNSNELQIVSDAVYLKFLKDYNGGLFFDKSLQIYGYTNKQEIHSLHEINEKVQLEYDIISAGNFFFACDVFGNQFCFDYKTKKIYLFNIESGQREFVANNFIEWIRILELETDYYTGQSLIRKWEEIMPPLNYDERLTTKIPFVLGGEFNLGNLRVEKLDKILEFNSSIAKQIFDLPDGTPINIKLD